MQRSEQFKLQSAVLVLVLLFGGIVATHLTFRTRFVRLDDAVTDLEIRAERGR